MSSLRGFVGTTFVLLWLVGRTCAIPGPPLLLPHHPHHHNNKGQTFFGLKGPCLDTLLQDCGEFWHGSGQCYLCAQSHYASLTSAKCTTADTHAFCSPNVRCKDGLAKYCSRLVHQSGACWECVGNHSEDLASMGCTTAETHAFCSPTVPCDEALFEVCGEFLHGGPRCVSCTEEHTRELPPRCLPSEIQRFCTASHEHNQQSHLRGTELPLPLALASSFMMSLFPTGLIRRPF